MSESGRTDGFRYGRFVGSQVDKRAVHGFEQSGKTASQGNERTNDWYGALTDDLLELPDDGRTRAGYETPDIEIESRHGVGNICS